MQEERKHKGKKKRRKRTPRASACTLQCTAFATRKTCLSAGKCLGARDTWQRWRGEIPLSQIRCRRPDQQRSHEGTWRRVVARFRTFLRILILRGKFKRVFAVPAAQHVLKFGVDYIFTCPLGVITRPCDVTLLVIIAPLLAIPHNLFLEVL